MNPIPNLFIVGQPKSATSALYSYLKQHPDVCMGSTKEPQYFCRDLNSQYFHLAGLERTRENYLALFGQCSGVSVVGEGSTAYLYSKVAAEEIARFNPAAKIIVMLREPAEFLYSYHLQLLRNSCTFEVETDFEEALRLEQARKKGEKIPRNCLDPSFLYYSDRVGYAEQLERYYRVFPGEQIKVIIYDDFCADNKAVYLDVLNFLNLSDDYIPDMNVVNARVKVRSRRFKQGADKVLFPFKQAIRSRFSGGLYKRMRKIYRVLVFSKNSVAPLDQTLKREIQKRYRDEVVKLGEVLNRDLIRLWGYE